MRVKIYHNGELLGTIRKRPRDKKWEAVSKDGEYLKTMGTKNGAMRALINRDLTRTWP